jgi:hypothetical protein
MTTKLEHRTRLDATPAVVLGPRVRRDIEKRIHALECRFFMALAAPPKSQLGLSLLEL